MNLTDILNRTADRIVTEGTPTESRTLEALAAATRELCPGAAAALVDWNGSEIARLRAFGIVHGVVLGDLPVAARTQLMAQLTGVSAHELAA